MQDNVLPFKHKEIKEHKSMSAIEKMGNLFTVLESRMEAFNRKSDPRELSAILSEISQIQVQLDNLKKDLTSTVNQDNKKAG